MPKEGKWRCHVSSCGYRGNFGWRTKCKACGSRRPQRNDQATASAAAAPTPPNAVARPADRPADASGDQSSGPAATKSSAEAAFFLLGAGRAADSKRFEEFAWLVEFRLGQATARAEALENELQATKATIAALKAMDVENVPTAVMEAFLAGRKPEEIPLPAGEDMGGVDAPTKTQHLAAAAAAPAPCTAASAPAVVEEADKMDEDGDEVSLDLDV
ncbi:hypothetical protein OIDMADRAFT_56296 [Oidiodendron maius Zn]|uniref:RanBP2-type domain-containing protein n=1 Tax=Oidiodendron maius (strain Zn) TaxID=913774 RepID=A0A0C3H7D0_OIDMZ|nr:hypothetical protein OIDMADRAFT_56296 [Oidiodendron maius Zn]